MIRVVSAQTSRSCQQTSPDVDPASKQRLGYRTTRTTLYSRNPRVLSRRIEFLTKTRADVPELIHKHSDVGCQVEMVSERRASAHGTCVVWIPVCGQKPCVPKSGLVQNIPNTPGRWKPGQTQCKKSTRKSGTAGQGGWDRDKTR